MTVLATVLSSSFAVIVFVVVSVILSVPLYCCVLLPVDSSILSYIAVSCQEGVYYSHGFVEWLDGELALRNWRPADLARAAGISTGSLSQIYTGARNPGPDIALAIARGFNLPADHVFRQAGLLPGSEGPDRDPSYQEILDIMRNMSVEERREIVEYALFRFQRKKQT